MLQNLSLGRCPGLSVIATSANQFALCSFVARRTRWPSGHLKPSANTCPLGMPSFGREGAFLGSQCRVSGNVHLSQRSAPFYVLRRMVPCIVREYLPTVDAFPDPCREYEIPPCILLRCGFSTAAQPRRELQISRPTKLPDRPQKYCLKPPLFCRAATRNTDKDRPWSEASVIG